MVGMAEVTIDIPTARRGPHEYLLEISIVNTSAQDLYPPEDHYRFTVHETLRSSETTRVFKGELIDSEGVPYPEAIVCKLVQGDTSDVEIEAKLYTSALEDVQGYLVPPFAFYATGNAPDVGTTVAALFTVYAGEALKGNWVDVPMTTRYVFLCPG